MPPICSVTLKPSGLVNWYFAAFKAEMVVSGMGFGEYAEPYFEYGTSTGDYPTTVTGEPVTVAVNGTTQYTCLPLVMSYIPGVTLYYRAKVIVYYGAGLTLTVYSSEGWQNLHNAGEGVYGPVIISASAPIWGEMHLFEQVDIRPEYWAGSFNKYAFVWDTVSHPNPSGWPGWSDVSPAASGYANVHQVNSIWVGLRHLTYKPTLTESKYYFRTAVNISMGGDWVWSPEKIMAIGIPPTPPTPPGNPIYGALYGTGGDFLGFLSNWVSLTIVRRVNAPATGILVLDGRDRIVPLLQTDTQLQIYRSNPQLGIRHYREAELFHRTSNHSWDENAQYQFTSTLVGYEDLLSRRIILGGDDEPFANMGMSSEKVMKELVRVQCGLSGTRNIIDYTTPGLTIDACLDRGPIWQGYEYEANLLDYLQKIGEGKDMAFKVVGTTPSHFVFKSYPIPYGADRRAPSLQDGRNMAGNTPIVFSEQLGNCTDVKYALIREGEGTVGIVRQALLVADSSAELDSPWNHREFAVSVSNMSDPGSDMATAMQRMAAREDCQVVILQVPSCAYGKDYFLGDWVSVFVSAPGVLKTITKVITQVTIKIERNEGQLDESIAIELSDLPMTYRDPVHEAVSNLGKRTRTLETRASALEVK